MAPRLPLSLLASLAVACADPVHDDAVEALGGEAPGVPVGALHRPGQPCVTCHGDHGPAESRFTVAGTVYALPREPLPAAGAVVDLLDATGDLAQVGVNAAGNFYVREQDWDPVFPLKVKVALGPLTKQMTTYVARARSCSDCHTSVPGPTSPGQVFIADNPSDLPPLPVAP